MRWWFTVLASQLAIQSVAAIELTGASQVFFNGDPEPMALDTLTVGDIGTLGSDTEIWIRIPDDLSIEWDESSSPSASAGTVEIRNSKSVVLNAISEGESIRVLGLRIVKVGMRTPPKFLTISGLQ